MSGFIPERGWELTGRVDEREVHREGNNGFREGSEERFDHVADSINIRAAVNWRVPCHPKNQHKSYAWAE